MINHNRNDIKKKIENFIIHYNKKNKISFNTTTSIFENGLLDSFGFVELISFCEKEYNIDISNINFFDEFKNIDKISKYLDKAIKLKS